MVGDSFLQRDSGTRGGQEGVRMVGQRGSRDCSSILQESLLSGMSQVEVEEE